MIDEPTIGIRKARHIFKRRLRRSLKSSPTRSELLHAMQAYLHFVNAEDARAHALIDYLGTLKSTSLPEFLRDLGALYPDIVKAVNYEKLRLKLEKQIVLSGKPRKVHKI